MKLYWVKTNFFIKRIFKNFVWDLPNKDNKIYLTFDDGPTPKITPWVLDLLQQHNIKATFFCIGENIQKYPEIFKRIISEGHSIGNHTYNHLNGWKTSKTDYIENVKKCELEITKFYKPKTPLFRPPYGKILPLQTKSVLEMGYKIIMWDILTVDYDQTISSQKCLQNATQKAVSGSVIIFHDSEKAFPNLEYALPKTIKYLLEKGFTFERI